MSKLTTLPASAPFAPEQILALNNVFGSASTVQRAWLSGFLAGLDAGEAKPATAAAPPAEKAKLTILYATESGNAEALAAKAKQEAAKRGFATKLLDMGDATLDQLKTAGSILAIVSTWGDGEPPQRAAPFMRAFMSDAAPRLEGVKFAVLALGDSSYAQFCETGKQVDARFAALGAIRAAYRIDLDLDYEAQAKSWIASTLETLAPKDAGSVIHVDFHKIPTTEAASKTAPFAAEILAHHKLTSERADSETYHVELALAGSGITYEPGDALAVVPQNDPALVSEIIAKLGLAPEPDLTEALTSRYDITTLTAKQMKDYALITKDDALSALAEDAAKRNEFLNGRQIIDLLEAFPHRIDPEAFTALLRPLAPRSYSIASSQKSVGEEAHLTVARVAYESAGRARKGVASTLMSDRRKAGGLLDVFVKPNQHFRLPKDPAAPIVMIGAGTGVAPYRGFLQEREATGATGKNWLIFGHRHFLYDFLYQLEIQAWLQSGVLSRLDLATSRDQPEKRYVQHVLWEQRDALRNQLAKGAVLYLCGDAKAMARDVDATLVRIFADGKDEAAGQSALDALITAGRYKKDVY
ncbi:MAG: sulfite reductase subunit alpha [Acidocella sp. 20-57-95]|nr:MAG: sulfite reductase subunit alpha [Acidocella sp. 20-57-95]OYV61865.1 MAG: sulfite reductase subunit alpha [Acidocella sp. 21-58-7]HQT63613.1 flavodoxin domain-containing protein [Acidocella sp.]HQU04193.1 flavodoxin domain-containing protein [Acidocella sp.]